METRYYEKLGRGSDFLLRCKDCRRLVTLPSIVKAGACRCGNRRFVEITTLSGWEMLKIWVGLVRFPYRREFLKEFRRAA